MSILTMKYVGDEVPGSIYSRLWKPQTDSDGLKANLFHNMWSSTSGGFGTPGSVSYVNSMYANMVCFRVYDVAGDLVISTDTSVPPIDELESGILPEGKFVYELHFKNDDPEFPG